MIKTLSEILKADKRISAFKITENQKDGLEWYFVGKNIDSVRSVENTNYEVIIYVDGTMNDGKKSRGAYSVTIHPTASKEDILNIVDRSVKNASGIKNQWFPLPSKADSQNAEVFPKSGFSAMSLETAMEEMRKALYSAEDSNSGKDGKAKINSLELFISKIQTRIINSEGIDVTWEHYNGYCEFVVCAKDSKHEEVELFGDISFSEPNKELLCTTVKTKLRQCEDRLNAVTTPNLENIPVIFGSEQTADLYLYWQCEANAQFVYEKRSEFVIGDNIGDKITLEALPFIKDNPESRPYDKDGFALHSVNCIENGILKNVNGSTAYTYYLNSKATGELPLLSIVGGSKSKEELFSQDHIEAAIFSDFNVDELTGNFCGEIRLAYLVKDGKRTAITSGSISGSLVKNRGKIELSREIENNRNGQGPKYCLIPKATIAGAE